MKGWRREKGKVLRVGGERMEGDLKWIVGNWRKLRVREA